MFQKMYDISKVGNYFSSISLLFARLIIAYGFYEPALNKLKDINGMASWYASIGIIYPTLSAYLSGIFEALGVVLLALGLFTRLISVPLIFIMIVAIYSVHFSHGFSSASNGFEIPLYYAMFLFIFFTQGAGAFSLDKILFEKNK